MSNTNATRGFRLSRSLSGAAVSSQPIIIKIAATNTIEFRLNDPISLVAGQFILSLPTHTFQNYGIVKTLFDAEGRSIDKLFIGDAGSIGIITHPDRVYRGQISGGSLSQDSLANRTKIKVNTGTGSREPFSQFELDFSELSVSAGPVLILGRVESEGNDLGEDFVQVEFTFIQNFFSQ